jgi:hypothetical protein
MISQRDMDFIRLEAQEIIFSWLEEFYKNYLSREIKNGGQGNY